MKLLWMGCDWSMSEFKYLDCVFDELSTDNAVCYSKCEESFWFYRVPG